jgi:hypothetical protein
MQFQIIIKKQKTINTVDLVKISLPFATGGGWVVLLGRFDDRGGGAGLKCESFSVRSESRKCLWSTGIGERVTDRAGESDGEGIGRDTRDDVCLQA